MIDDKTFKSVLALAKSSLPFVPADSVYDDLYSAAGAAIAEHLGKGGKADKLLLVRVAQCEMIDELRRNKKRYRHEASGVDVTNKSDWAADWKEATELLLPLPQPRKKVKKALLLDARFPGIRRKPTKSEPSAQDYEVWNLSVYEKMPPDEIAQRLGINHTTVLKSLRRIEEEVQDRDIMELKFKELTPDEIAKLLGISLTVVKKCIREFEAEERRDQSREMEARLIELASQGLTQEQIAEELHISQAAVCKRIKQIKAAEREWKEWISKTPDSLRMA